MSKPFRFGVQSFNTTSGVDWTRQVCKAEELGYSTFHLADHIIGEGPALTRANHPVQDVAAIPAMAHAAAVSSTINIGCRVFCIDYHNPVVLVKSAMTIDMLSNGRLELGLGAGWVKDEYEAIGLQMDEPKVRIDRLADVIEGVKAFRGEGPADVSNKTLQWSEFSGAPKPVGRVPIMIGGGSPRVLRLAGREADIVSLNFNNRSGQIGADGVGLSTSDETTKKIAWIKEGAGDRFADIEIEIGAYFTFVMDDPSPVVQQFSQVFGLSEEDMERHPHALFGSVEAIVDELERRREKYGISYVTINAQNMDAFAPIVERLSGK
ncbi:MAG: TIGR03621 family F420-dependent LLM class oxidoreductase [Pseudomonadales bacterium]|nr:TIGR03621 family F420-dependent LLM class oxidoreductase [Pseudomonadales bacterium]